MLVDNAIVVPGHLPALRGERARPWPRRRADVGLADGVETLTSIIVFAPIVLGGNDGSPGARVGVTLSVT
jgi:hypothetical protein